MDAIHCYSCAHVPGTSVGTRQYFLTSCGHVFCGQCNSLVLTQNECLVCNNKCKSVEVGPSSRPEIKSLFCDPSLPQIKTIQQQIEQFARAVQFQIPLHKSFAVKYRKLVERNNELEKQNQNLVKEVQSLKTVYEDVKTKLENTEQQQQSWLGNSSSTTNNTNNNNFISLPPSLFGGSPLPQIINRNQFTQRTPPAPRTPDILGSQAQNMRFGLLRLQSPSPGTESAPGDIASRLRRFSYLSSSQNHWTGI